MRAHGTEGEAAWAYHERTKHSLASVRASRHTLDWENQPIPYKIYEELAPIELPRTHPPLAMPALAAIGASAEPSGPRVPDLAALARVLHLSAGIVRKAIHPGGREVYFRAAACTGALYHVDLYVACRALDDLEAGLYHFGTHDFALRRLRSGDHRRALVAAAADDAALAAAPVIVVCASTFWRNAWKYQARTYRHAFWDTGTILANLFAVAAADDLPARLVLGFADAAVNRLLGLDGEHEAALALIGVGHDPAPPPPAPASPALALATVPLSAHTIDYPEIREAHAASSLMAADEVRRWREAARAPSAAPAPSHPPGGGIALATPASDPGPAIDAVIRKRGSSRSFARTAITFAELSTLLARATGSVASDVTGEGRTLGEVYVIAHAVDGLAPGAYAFDRARAALTPLREGDVRREAGFLGLGQDLPADASVNLYVLADLGRILGRLGDRGYRAAQLEAAITGGRLYLAAYALGLGATGLTFFDDDVTRFFSPHAAGKSVMFLVAVGHGRRRPLPTVT
jgi:SagB-type dehydrogenase family enzyme